MPMAYFKVIAVIEIKNIQIFSFNNLKGNIKALLKLTFSPI